MMTEKTERTEKTEKTIKNPKWNESKLSSKERYILKASAGLRMAQAPPEAIVTYYRIRENGAGNISRYRDEIQFECLCMSCMWDENVTQKLPFQKLMREVICTTKTENERFMNLLNERWRGDGFMLQKICSLAKKMQMKKRNVKPDFEKLADDLAAWNSESRYVQMNWIKEMIK